LLFQRISIHAPREGSDRLFKNSIVNYNISIHAPREGSDGFSPISSISGEAFQSTLPVRGATIDGSPQIDIATIFQSTLPVRGATRPSRPPPNRIGFQSTLPVRGAT